MRRRYGLALAPVLWPFVEPLLPVLRRTTVPVLPPDVRPFTVLHLSDLHLLPRHRSRSRWVRGLARHRPDLVVSTGDHLSSAAAIPLLARTLAAFDAPTLFVPGNNDYYCPLVPRPLGYLRDDGPPKRRGPDLPWPDAVRALTEAGCTDLTHRRLALPELGVTVTGTDDAHLRRDRYRLVQGPVEGFGVGVTHTPADRLLTRFADDGHGLVLAGHTHGGQLRLPVLGPATSNCDLPRSRARGLTRDRRGWLHVSAGLGTSPYAPVRLCCRPEATLIRLAPRSAEQVR